jgi:hypothetical protein
MWRELSKALMSMMPRRPVVVLTGDPGGGKSSLMEELKQDPAWDGRLLFLPQAVQAMHTVNRSPREKLFQRVLVNLQMGLEDGLARSAGFAVSALVCYNCGCHILSYDYL